MAETFEKQLATVAGTIHRVYMDGGEHQHRMENGLLYYFNKANDLRKSTEILMANGGSRDTWSMLAGMSLDVLLKGIARALDNPAKPTHSLTDLAKHVGIAFTEDEGIILDVMSEHIYWAGRYTAPRKPEDWIKVWELQSKQRRPSGKLADMDIPSRTISIGTYRRLWAKFANCFHQARESSYESAEFKWEQESRKT
jgi:HEPN domain-containing protein